jgi:hypothetical protein
MSVIEFLGQKPTRRAGLLASVLGHATVGGKGKGLTLKAVGAGFNFQNFVLHGFRTTFSSWATEMGYAHRDIEMALDHVVRRTGPEEDAERLSESARIYSRNAKRLEGRRKLLENWGEYCSRTEPLPAGVIPMRRAKGRGQSHA